MRKNKYPDTGESGDTYSLEHVHPTLPNNKNHEPSSSHVPMHLPELQPPIPEQPRDEKILLERVLAPRPEKLQTPYGSPYHRTPAARNYRKDLDKKVIIGEEPLDDAYERAKRK